jgi:hypothetical protein
MKVKGFLIQGEENGELLLSVQPVGRAMIERLVRREPWAREWVDAEGVTQPSRTQATQAVLKYVHRLWQMSGPLQVLDH